MFDVTDFNIDICKDTFFLLRIYTKNSFINNLLFFVLSIYAIKTILLYEQTII